MIQVYPANYLSSVEQLRGVLEGAICNPVTKEVIHDEIDGVLEAIDLSINGFNDRYYAVAVSPENIVLGTMGLQPPEDRMLKYTTGLNPIELKNAYVAKDQRGLGIGRLLVQHLEQTAKDRNHDEIILNSGVRYRFSGWPFWRSVYGEPVATAKGYYDGKYDAKVWRKKLE